MWTLSFIHLDPDLSGIENDRWNKKWKPIHFANCFCLNFIFSTFRTMQCLQPVDPDIQKHFIQKQYNLKIQQAIKLFTMDIKQRAIHLFKHVNVSILMFLF